MMLDVLEKNQPLAILARKGKLRILVVTGSSGGHIFPALSFLDTLKDRHQGLEILLVLPRISLKNIILNEEWDLNKGEPWAFGYRVSYISISTIRLSIDRKNIFAVLNFVKGSLESLWILLRFQPDIVVGFGSLVCIPLVMLAWVFRIKTLIHEQNVIPGRTNRLLAKFTDRIAVSFAQTKDFLRVNQDRIVLTGNPIRQGLKRIDRPRACSFFGFNNEKFTILVMGGSQGSHNINMCFLNAISMIPDKSKFQVIHIAGVKDYALLDKGYKDLFRLSLRSNTASDEGRNLNLKVKLFSFLEDMQYAYSICDLAICRAGATTIAELISFGLPAIIVPYPFAYSHQMDNAKVLEEKGCAIVIEDHRLDADILRRLLDDLMNNPDKIKLMRSHYEGLRKYNANDLLVDEVLSLN